MISRPAIATDKAHATTLREKTSCDTILEFELKAEGGDWLVDTLSCCCTTEPEDVEEMSPLFALLALNTYFERERVSDVVVHKRFDAALPRVSRTCLALATRHSNRLLTVLSLMFFFSIALARPHL